MKIEATRIVISGNLNLCIFEFLINPDPLCSFTRIILYSRMDCIENSNYKLWGPNQFLRILNNIQLFASTWYNIAAYDIKNSGIILQKSIIPLESFHISRELISEICNSVNSKEIQETLDRYVRE